MIELERQCKPGQAAQIRTALRWGRVQAVAVVCLHQAQLCHAGRLRASHNDVIQHANVDQVECGFQCAGQHAIGL